MPTPTPSPSPGPKRRLPVLNSPAGAAGDDPTPRSPWQWVAFGALAVFTVWIPLAGIAGALAARLGESAWSGAGAAIVAIYVTALALGAGLGGYLVGRWGTARVGAREAAIAGFVASAVAVAATWIAFGASAGSVLVAVVATPIAALGGRLGVRARRH